MDSFDCVEKVLQESTAFAIIEEMIRSNKAYFEVSGVKYCLKCLNLKEREQLNQYLAIKKFELLNQGVPRESDLIEKYKGTDNDIDNLTKRFVNIDVEYRKKLSMLGKAVASNASPKEVDVYEKDLASLKKELCVIQERKTDLLSGCFESLFLECLYKYQVFLSLYQVSEEKEVRLFTDYEEYLTIVPDDVIYTAIAVTALMDNYAKYSN